MYKLLLLAVSLILLPSCASNPSYKKSQDEMDSVLSKKAVCCESIQMIPRMNIQKLPYETANWSQSDWAQMDENSPVYVFDNYKGYVMAISLPEHTKKIQFNIQSMSTGGMVPDGGFYFPIVRTYDSNFKEISVHDNIAVTSQNYLEGTFIFENSARYIIIHTTKEALSRRSKFTYSTMEGMRLYSSDHNKPHLPEGLFRLKVTEKE